MIERLLKVGVGLLALDGNAKQAGKARKEVCIRLVKLAGVGAIDFQNAEGLIALRSPFYQNVDGPPDTVVRLELRRTETCLRF